jgi:predicted  nucleic acid-binding Zn-ribbon protein
MARKKKTFQSVEEQTACYKAEAEKLKAQSEQMQLEIDELHKEKPILERRIAAERRRIESAVRNLIATHGVDAAPLIIAALCDEEDGLAPSLRLRK